MDCNVPTDIVFSFSGLALRGGLRGPHSDGWGLALYEGRAARAFLEPRAAHDSALARYVRENPIKTLLAVAHVRRRTRGKIALENTHPFVRELWGRTFVFAHNGTVKAARRLELGRFRPVGTTDSEHAFCALLHGLDRRFKSYPRDVAKLWRAVATIGAEIGAKGTFNFLLADGRHLFARCATKLCHIIRKAPFGEAHLSDDEVSIDFASVTTPRDRVVIVATQPLTKNETWTTGQPNTLWVFSRGRLRATLPA
jgi:glutamine amidotransferase